LSAARIYRRFVLEALLALRTANGELRANALARATGLRAQSFANKARELVALRSAERVELGGRPPAVEYRLTEEGKALGSLAFALMTYKSYQCLLAVDAAGPRAEGQEGFPFPLDLPTVAESGADALLRDTVIAADSLLDIYLARRGGPTGPGALEVRRYAETCVRRWHGEVLGTLEMGGPLRFSDLRSALGVGDEALARALRSLVALGAVRKAGPAYAITPWGRGDVAIGATLILLDLAAIPT
jgi:DNA-binding HxlR family transcriptional regulator